MATLTIEKLDNSVLERLKIRARANDRSVEDEACALLAQQLPDPARLQAVIDDMAAFRQRMKEKYGEQQTDSVALIRAIRDGE
jgi:plasmid stability protein